MTIVFISGCFDCFHEGHLFLLKEAKKLGDKLVVAINYDKYFERKGSNRPIDALNVRIGKIQATGLVNEIYAIEDSPLELILKLKPNIIVTGDDYKEDKIVGFKECKEWGGKVIRIRRIPEYSTTNIIITNSKI